MQEIEKVQHTSVYS